MADGFIEVTPSTDPSLKKVDNEVVNNDAAVSVFRQKVAVVNSDDGPLTVGTHAVTDGGGSLTVDGTVTANAGTGPFPISDGGNVISVDDAGSTLSVDDGAGSLTVDGSVSVTGALPAGTNNIGDVDVLTLPALPAGTNNIGDVDVLTLPATPTGDNRIGRVKITDDTDVATLVPLRTQPATTEVTIPTFEIPNRLATYATTIATQTPAITVGVKELLAVWNASTALKDKYIVEIWASAVVTTASTAGRTAVRVSTITSAPTGGTELTKVDISGAGASDITNTMQVKTGGGAIGTTFIRKLAEWATQTVGRIDIPVFTASNPGNGIILRGGTNAGISIDIEREVAHTALVDLWTVGIRWLEV